MSVRMRSTFLLLCLLTVVHTFGILRKDKSRNHQEITRTAVLRATATTCVETEGFTMPKPLNMKTLAEACGKMKYEDHFEKAIRVICYYNVKTDLLSDPEYHFNNEKFKMGRKLITDGITKITGQVMSQSFDDARETLGEILHTLQDFYSHSNWIELGNTSPYTALINPDEELKNIADELQETCEKDCVKKTCRASLKEDIINNKILTSGYFGSKKPAGKCSHGGGLDLTTGFGKSWNGINKDSRDSSHGSLHKKAAVVAIEASVKLLENIRDKINNPNSFLRLVGLHEEKPKGSLKTLLFSAFKDRYPDASEGAEFDD
ncbi:von Willebrand factor A domain-containing protein 7-like [Triplophysa rosa]|nr:von Willebrand factor A domain-containing protein 7-like [Triplophysa rosa]